MHDDAPSTVGRHKRRQRSVRASLAGVVVLASAALGVLVASMAASAADPPGSYTSVIAGSPTVLCKDDGPISMSHALPDPNESGMHATAEAAVRAFEDLVAGTATLGYHAHFGGAESHPVFDGLVPDGIDSGPTLTEAELHELVDLLAPSRSFRTTVSTPVQHEGVTKYLFDVPSSETGVVEARIAVESTGDRWHVATVYACASTFVTDFDRFQELKRKEIG